MKKTKETAFIAPYITGYFCFEPTKEWLGKNYYGNTVVWGKTRKECERMCRENGYVPVRDR